MLKLLKYEWKACARTCLPLYGVLILMSLISRILYVIPKNASLDFMLPAIGSMLYMGVMMAAFVVTAVILIQRFYKNPHSIQLFQICQFSGRIHFYISIRQCMQNCFHCL